VPRLGRTRPASAYGRARPVTIFAPVQAAQFDVAAGVEALTAPAAVPQADVAAAVESMAIVITVADAAGAVESASVAAAAPQADVAGAAEALGVAATAPQADVAGAADAMSISVGPLELDAAGAVDSMTEAVAAPQHEAAGAVEAMTFPVPIASAQADVAGAKDSATVSAAIPQADVAGAADSIQVSAAVPVAQVAAAVEAVTFPVPITAPQHEAAGAVDSMTVSKVGLPTFGGTLPGVVVSTTLPPGYQGGPSGSASVPPSALGNSWEIEVRSASDYATLLAVIPGTMLLTWQFARMLNDLGSGTVVLNQDDPWWSTVTLPGGLAPETLLDEECLWQVWKDGVCRFEFFGETVTEQLVDGSEQRQATVTGPGTLTSLKWAMVAPQGFPNIVLKLDGLLDAFDEVDNNGNPVLDTNIWTTHTPSSAVYITPIAVIYNYPTGAGYALSTLYPSGSLTLSATPGTTFLGASPYDATDTLISAQITPIGVSSSATDTTTPAAYGTGLDGSELTQFYIQSNTNSNEYALIGLTASAFYAQLGSGSGSVQTKVLPPYDSQNHAYWMITEQAGGGGGAGTFYFWTSPDGQQWTLQWQVVHAWDATNVTFFIAATYDVSGTQSVQVANLNSNVTTPSYQGSIYLGQPMMGIWFDQLAKAQARGTIPFVTSTATPAADSYGRTWADIENVQANNGTDLYSFLQGATSVVDADYVMDPGFQLRVGVPAAGQVTLGVDRSGYIVFREGDDVMAKQRVRARDKIATLIGGENSDGHEISASSPTFIAEWGQREGWFQTAAQVDPTSLAYATASTLAQTETEVISWSFQLLPNVPGKTVFDNFDVGDWVGLERPDFSAVDKVRVVGIAVQADASGAETHELTFQSYIQWLAEQLTYLANKLGGSFVNTQGTTPVAPSKYGTGQVPTWFTPAATLSGLADVASTAGTAQGTAPLVYNPATGTYQHAGSTDPVTGQMIPVTVTTPSGSVTVGDTTVVVNNGSGAGSTTIGLQGDGTVTTVDSGGNAPGIPDTPTVAGTVQGISAFWDGLLAGALPLSNFQHVEFHVSTTNGFTPSAATLMHTQAAAAGISVTGLNPGTTYYVKLVAVTTAGVASAPSPQASAVAAGLPTSELTGELPASLIGNSAGAALNPNPFFNGGDLTGWTVVNGTLAASNTPPAGVPGAAQWVARVASTSANCLITGSTAPFPTQPGQPYSMTAWVYNPGGSAVNVAIGFNWAGGTSTFSIPAGGWVPMSVVQVCPGGVTSGYQVIGPTGSGVTLYVLGAVAIGQIPGSLLAANTVTASQIAAGTITATQIAAGTITASQIAANTITAGQIAANTITATQIATGTITAAQIATHTITATQIAAGTITGTQIAASVSLTSPSISGGTITGASLIADGSSGEILVYSSVPASGDLIGSWSAVSGTDGSGNGFNAGLWVYDSGGNSIGLVPGGGGGATQLAMSAGAGTPTPPSGCAALFGTTVGGVNVVDAGDGMVYAVGRRTQILTSSTGISSGGGTSLFSQQLSVRSYRVHGVLYLSISGSAQQFFLGVGIPGTAVGQYYCTLSRAAVLIATTNFGSNALTAIGPSASLAAGNVYTAVFDGVAPVNSAGTMVITTSCTNTGNIVIAQNSFVEFEPV
jgi:hypothetical protein